MRGGAAVLSLLLAGCANVPAPSGPPPLPATMQYLYGSGEAAAASLQAWRELVGYARERVASRPTDSMVLAAGATLAAPRWETCGAKPFAAVFDVDETVLLNRGFEYDAAMGAPFEDKRWQAYERTGVTTAVAVPGAKAALDALRVMGVTVIFNTNRSAANAEATQMALERNGLGPAKHGETLYLAGDDATGSHKDARRAVIAARWCVIALGGDQLGDFSDLFNVGPGPVARREAVLTEPLASKWGAGWFILPNPVYGSALKGGIEDVFPSDARWAPEP